MNKWPKWISIIGCGILGIFIVVPLMLGMLGSITRSKSSNLAQNAQVRTYYNANKEIKFQYPGSWKIDETIIDGPKPIIAKFDREKDVTLMLFHSLNNENLTLEQYLQSTIKELEFAPGYSLVSQNLYELNGVPAYEVTANFESNVKSRAILFLSPDSSRLFTITYRATQNTFDNYLNELETILNTVQVK